MSARTIYDLRPEPKFERANESAAGAISKVRACFELLMQSAREKLEGRAAV